MRILLTFCVLAAGAAVFSAASGAQGDPPAKPAERYDYGATAREHMGLVRRARTESDQVDPAVAASPLLDDGIGTTERSRRVQVSGTRRAWVMPGRNGSLCFVVPGAMSCAPESVLADDGVAPTISGRRGEPTHVEGIAADGVRSVTVRFADGSVVEAPVRDNAFSVDGEALASSLEWRFRGRTVSLSVAG